MKMNGVLFEELVRFVYGCQLQECYHFPLNPSTGLQSQIVVCQICITTIPLPCLVVCDIITISMNYEDQSVKMNQSS